MAVSEDREYRKRSEFGRISIKEEVKARIKLVADILRKEETERTDDEKVVLDESPEAVQEVLKRDLKKEALKDRVKEFEDPPQTIQEKCSQLIDLIKSSKNVVVYTGAGISTAASIPDYRGPNGVWTLLQQGKSIKTCNLSKAEPTFTHMALVLLEREKIITHVVSQNCDGLHLRSGLPRAALSELHGNMFIEVCKMCDPPKEYIRLFDVTEKTSFRKHKTGRKCHACGHDLIDTIVHFGERGTLKSPLNWDRAIEVASKCDLILCLGSSLRVLRRYTCLWGIDRPIHDRPKLCIVNLQWTPKDQYALLKINGQCDSVMKQIVDHLSLNTPLYNRVDDPLFELATRLVASEAGTTTRHEMEVVCETGEKCEPESSDPLNNLIPKCEVPDQSGSCNSSGGDISELLIKNKTDSSGDLKKEQSVPLLEEAKIFVSETDKQVDEVPKGSRKRRGRPRKRKRLRGQLHSSDQVSTDAPGWFGKGYRKVGKKKF